LTDQGEPEDQDTGLLLPDDALPAGHRSGFVAVVGRPNVGKSTLFNRILAQKLAIVSPKPQTTRNRLLGILTRNDAQVIFMDTPGIHAPLHRLGKVMVEVAARAIPDADVVLWLVDATEPPTGEDHQVAELVSRVDPATSVFLVLNKVDVMSETQQSERGAAFAALAPGAVVWPISALRGDNVDDLLAAIIRALPLGPRYYPAEQVTDQQERFIAAELVREQVLLHLRQEVPHAVAVAVLEFKERREDLIYISAVIYVERTSQKGIVLGKDGAMLKQIGQGARKSIEEMLGARVYLDLWVKVRPDWRSNEQELRRLGYAPPKDD
jgi:GTP-binding protein Era